MTFAPKYADTLYGYFIPVFRICSPRIVVVSVEHDTPAVAAVVVADVVVVVADSRTEPGNNLDSAQRDPFRDFFS